MVWNKIMENRKDILQYILKQEYGSVSNDLLDVICKLFGEVKQKSRREDSHPHYYEQYINSELEYKDGTNKS